MMSKDGKDRTSLAAQLLLVLSVLYGISVTTACGDDLLPGYVSFGESKQRVMVDSTEIRLKPIADHQSAPVVNSLAASFDGTFLAAAGDDHVIRIVDVARNETAQVLSAHTDWIQALVFSADGQTLFSAGNDGRVLRWQHRYPVASQEVVQLPYAIRSLAISDSLGLLAIGGFSDEIVLLDLESASIVGRLPCPSKDQRSVAFSPDGALVACGCRDGSVHIWETETGEEIASHQLHKGRIHMVAFCSNGKSIASVATDRKLVQFDIESKAILRDRELAPSKLMSLCRINDDLFAVAGADNSIHLYDCIADKVVAHLAGHFGTVAALVPCGQSLASGSFDTSVRIWNLDSISARQADFGRPVYAPLRMDTESRVR